MASSILRGQLRSFPANGHSAFTPQIRKLVFECCDRWASSENTRTFLFTRLQDLARKNPHVEIVVRQRIHKEPILRGFYREHALNSHFGTLTSLASVNQRDKVIPLNGLSLSEIKQKVFLLLDSSGAKIKPLKRRNVESTTESLEDFAYPRHTNLLVARPRTFLPRPNTYRVPPSIITDQIPSTRASKMQQSLIRPRPLPRQLRPLDVDDVSLTLSIDELRWLHASESSFDSPIESSSPKIALFESSIPATTKVTGGSKYKMYECLLTLPSRSQAPTPGHTAAFGNPTPSTSRPASMPSPSPSPRANTLRVRTHPTTLSRGGGRTWDRHRHYHLVDDTPLSLSPSASASSTASSGSGSSSPSTATPTLTLTPTRRKPSSSLIPAPRSPAKPSSTTPTQPQPQAQELLSRSLPNPQAIPSPSPPRSAWIHRHPKPRTVRPPPLALSTSNSATSALSATRPVPSSPLASSHTHTHTRTRTRSINRQRPQMGYTAHSGSSSSSGSGNHHHHALSHANTENRATSASPTKRVVHSVLPARGTAGTSAKDKDKEKERSIWAMFKPAEEKNVCARDASLDVEEGSPESRIMDIVNANASTRWVGYDLGKDADKDKEKGILRLKKGKGLALVMGRGRSSSSPHKRSASLPSTVSTSSVATTTVTAAFVPSTPTSPRNSPVPRNRASSASSNSTNSTTSALSASTAATSPSPSVPASPKPPSSLSSHSHAAMPTKSILSRSASTSSRAAAPPTRTLAALFTRGASGSSVSSSVKSVTFVEEPTVHYPVEYGVSGESEYEQESEQEGGHTSNEDEEEEDVLSTKELPEIPDASTVDALDRAKAQQAQGKDSKPKSTVRLGTLDLELDEDDLATGLSKGALAWEMGFDVDTMDLDLSLELDVPPGVNLDAPLEFDIGQRYVAPARDAIGGIVEEDEEELLKDDEADESFERGRARKRDGKEKKKGADGLKRLLSLTRSAKMDSSKRPAISGPFTLGSLPPTTPPPSSFTMRSPSLSVHHPSAGRSTTSLRSRSGNSPRPSRSRSNSNTTTHTYPLPHQPRTRSPYYHASNSTPSTPTHHHKAQSYSHSQSHPRPPRSSRPRTAPSSPYATAPSSHTTTENTSPMSTTSSADDGEGPSQASGGVYASSLRAAASLESFRSAAGRSVRSLGSIKSTASARGFRAWLSAKVGIGSGAAEAEGEAED
ncbi:hypothetical protein H0H92_007452 [Tricholoma furcatifolium]|nr:hypothetical protein H0H92_007452 [Tricholoma furcatifolium]